jgi:hypothetical protein
MVKWMNSPNGSPPGWMDGWMDGFSKWVFTPKTQEEKKRKEIKKRKFHSPKTHVQEKKKP